jgi:hypothetical protein
MGPAGITIIDAKAWSGRVCVGRAVIGRLQSPEREDVPVDRRAETVGFVRVVRFTDVTAERVESLAASRPTCRPDRSSAEYPAGERAREHHPMAERSTRRPPREAVAAMRVTAPSERNDKLAGLLRAV